MNDQTSRGLLIAGLSTNVLFLALAFFMLPTEIRSEFKARGRELPVAG